MLTFISQLPAFLISFLGLALLSTSCVSNEKVDSDPFSEIRQGKIALTSGRMIDITLAITIEEQTQGLSGVQDKDYSPTQGMLFFYLEDSPKRFWMPDTYFALDIFFLNKDLKVIGVDRNVAPHPGRNEPPTIPTTGMYYARHVLELRADSPMAKEINLGDTLKWSSPHSLSQIESKIRQKQ
jgi:hypothetical protein